MLMWLVQQCGDKMLLVLREVSTYHPTYSFINHEDLVSRKIFRVDRHFRNKFVNVWRWFTFMFGDKHVLGKFGDLEESF